MLAPAATDLQQTVSAKAHTLVGCDQHTALQNIPHLLQQTCGSVDGLQLSVGVAGTVTPCGAGWLLRFGPGACLQLLPARGLGAFACAVQTAAAAWRHLLLLLPVRWVRLQHKQMYIMVVACLGYHHPCPGSAAQAVVEVAHTSS